MPKEKSRLDEELLLLQDRRVRDLLQRLHTALGDWLHTYADEFCEEDKVAETHRRLFDEGGTLLYIAKRQEEIREILKEKTPYNSLFTNNTKP